MTTVGILSTLKDKKSIVHLIDGKGARTRCGSFSAWGTSFYSDRDPEVKFLDIERADINGHFCGRCLLGLDIGYEQGFDEDSKYNNKRGQKVSDVDELITKLKNQNAD